jgi:hypothetical protein
MLILVDNSKYFKFIIYALHECLTELNIVHDIITDYNNDYKYTDTDIYLICTTHEQERNNLPKRYISYNFEQLMSEFDWNKTDIFKNLRKAELVFDYSLENIKLLKQYNINAHFLPLGFTKSMVFDKIDNLDRNIDFTFIGKCNDHRYNIILPLFNVYNDCINRLAIYNGLCWDKDLEYVYTHTKIGLNIHYYKNSKTIFEIVRIILYLANKIIVITEKSNDEWYDNKYKDLVYFFETDNYTIDCFNVLLKYNFEQAEKNYQELIKNHKYVDYVKKIIHLIS